MPANTVQSQVADPIWTAIRAEAWSEEERDPFLRQFLTHTILKSRKLEDALAQLLSSKLATECVNPALLRSLFAAFTGRTGVSRYGSHWADLGFQGQDPATDLRR